MTPAQQSTLWTYVITAAIVGFAVYRRTRQQPVRPRRTVLWAAVIVLLSAFGVVSTGRTQVLALELAPLALAIGIGVGWLMMGTIRFWRDAETGQLWMKGGVLYVLIWLACYVLRMAVTTMAGAPPGTFTPARGAPPEPLPLAILSSDLLFLSMGLWIARAAALVTVSVQASV